MSKTRLKSYCDVNRLCVERVLSILDEVEYVDEKS